MRIEKATLRHSSSMSAWGRCHSLGSHRRSQYRRAPARPLLRTDHRRRRDVHEPPAPRGAIEPSNQRDRVAIAVNQPDVGGFDPGAASKPYRQHLSSRDRALVGDAGKLADRQMPLVIDDGAFRAQSAERCAATAQIGEIGCGFGVGLDRTTGGVSVPTLEERLLASHGGSRGA